MSVCGRPAVFGAPPGNAVISADTYFAPLSSAEELRVALAGESPVYVLLHASWCGHCRAFLEEVARTKRPGRLPRCHAMESAALDGLDLSFLKAAPEEAPDSEPAPVQLTGYPAALYIGPDGRALFGVGGPSVRKLFGKMAL